MKSCLVMAAVAFTLLVGTPNSAFADDKKVVDILPVVSAADDAHAAMPEDTTHSLLRITPDKSELIRLEREAGSIIIGNPRHIYVLAESSTTLVVVPRAPGATHFTVLSKKGEVLMQRHVIVASPKEDYIRVKKVCLDETVQCQKTNVYYCPDMCHEIGQDLVDNAETLEDSAGSDESGDGGNSSSDVPPEDG